MPCIVEASISRVESASNTTFASPAPTQSDDCNIHSVSTVQSPSCLQPDGVLKPVELSRLKTKIVGLQYYSGDVSQLSSSLILPRNLEV